MRAYWILAGICMPALAVLETANAQDATTNQESRRWQTEYLTDLDDATAQSPNAGLDSKILFEGSEDKGVATLRIGSVFGSSEANIRKWSVSASAPFSGEKEDEREIGDLSGLTAGSSATLELGLVKTESLGVRAKRVGLNPSQVTKQRLEQSCEPYAKEVFGVEFAKVHEQFKSENPQQCSETLFESRVFDANPIVLDLQSRASADPEARKRLEELNAARKKYYRMFWNVVNEPGPMWTGGIRLKASKTSFKYFLETDLAKELSDSKMSGSVGVYVNRVFRTQLIGLAYNRVTNYAAGRKTQICTPIGTAGALDCGDKILGAPTRTAPDILSLEWRYLLSPRTIAISPIVEYDLDGHDWAARVPIYGAVNKDGDLVGGLSVNWDSKEDEVQAVVFFGKKFSLFD